MKTTIFILIIVVFSVAIGKPTINFNPFKISFETPYFSFALAFLALAVLFHGIQYEKIGIKKGVDMTIEYLKDLKKEKDKLQ